jgi:DNA-binding transcriptional MerR regulator
MLGVDETTLRGWADGGKVRVFRTPGGHRRFNIADLDALLNETSRGSRGGFARREHAESPRHWFAARSWFREIDDEARARARAQCGRLMEALEAYVDGGQAHDLGSARRIGGDLGREVARWGLTPAQSTEIFLHFKRGVFDMLAGVRRTSSGQVRSLRSADDFLGEALHAMIEAFEGQRPA